MKKVLILAYDFPPYNSVGGQRPEFWFKYFKDFDILPTVVTRQWESTGDLNIDYISPSRSKDTLLEKSINGLIIRTPYKQTISDKLLLKYGSKKWGYIRKTFTLTREIFQFFFPIGNKINIYHAADNYLKENKIDVIIATGDPFVLFHYANKLSKKHNVKWIADYRDPWSHFNEKSFSLYNKFERFLEKRIVKNATHITSVSNFIIEKVHTLSGPKPSSVITNGFNSELLEKFKNIEQSSDFLVIAHAGTIYEWHPLERFLEAVSEFKTNRPNFNFRIVFYGLNQVSRLQNATKTFPDLVPHIQLEPRCSNEELIPKLKKHHVMLLFNYYAYMGTKIYDYMGVNRAILLCFENDPEAIKLKDNLYRINDFNATKNLQSKAIKKHKAGMDKSDLILILNQFADEFEEKKSIACQSVNTHIYSRTEQLQQLAELIKTNF
jgi:glycosyltransferase involved in cell wall biosynthesis